MVTYLKRYFVPWDETIQSKFICCYCKKWENVKECKIDKTFKCFDGARVISAEKIKNHKENKHV